MRKMTLKIATLRRRISLFNKLAQSVKEETKKMRMEEFENEFKHIMSRGNLIPYMHYIGGWISRNSDILLEEPKYFTMVLVELYKSAEDEGAYDRLANWIEEEKHKIPAKFYEEAKKLVVDGVLRDVNNMDVILEIEILLTDEQVRGLVDKAIKYAQEDPSIYNTEQLEILYNKSRKIKNKDAILRLIRKYNPEKFTRYYAPKEIAGPTNTISNRTDQANKFRSVFFDKAQYSINDILFFLERIAPTGVRARKVEYQEHKETVYGLNYQQLRDVIEKSTPSAKNMLRSVLFGTDDGKLFILDETMQPMNENYEHVNIGQHEFIERADRVPMKNGVRKQWQKIFEEFKIIPYGGFAEIWGLTTTK